MDPNFRESDVDQDLHLSLPHANTCQQNVHQTAASWDRDPCSLECCLDTAMDPAMLSHCCRVGPRIEGT